jgi:RecB family exonuclease
VDGDNFIIADGCNYSLTSSDRKFLQNATFNMLRSRGNLTISFAAKNYCDGRVGRAPAKVFIDAFHLFRGEFYSSAVGEKLLTSVDRAALQIVRDGEFFRSSSERSDVTVRNCAVSYAARHDLSKNLHDYCFAVDRKCGVKILCKAMEYLLKNPHIGFYDAILRLRPMPWQSRVTGKKISLGSFVHEFLQFPQAGAGFIRKTSIEVFYENIKSRSQKLKTLVAKAYTAADGEIPADFMRLVDFAAVLAKRLIERLFAIKNWQSFQSECIIPSDTPVKIGNGAIELSGRLDFLISDGIGGDKDESAVTIIDFKTGSDFELTERNVRWRMEKYESLQLFLYGLALRAIGFKHVKIMILKPDSAILNSAISMDYIIANVPKMLEKLGQVIETGLIERQILGKTFRGYFVDSVPLATTDLY